MGLGAIPKRLENNGKVVCVPVSIVDKIMKIGAIGFHESLDEKLIPIVAGTLLPKCVESVSLHKSSQTCAALDKKR